MRDSEHTEQACPWPPTLEWPQVKVREYLSHPAMSQHFLQGGRMLGLTTVQSPSQEELEHSLGESAAQGAAGAVLWMKSEKTSTKVSEGLGVG